MSLREKLDQILERVRKPARYIGGELGSVVKNPAEVAVRYALCFPDHYEIGMSHLGMKILYSLKNERADVWCERAFAPAADMEALMREREIPLYGLESLEPIRDFDMIGFSLQYELSFTSVLNMLDLAGLPVRSERRRELTPLVMAGGPCACNPEPLADFIDLFVLGEGEQVNLELIDLMKTAKREGWDKIRYLRAAAGIQGVYVPSLYEAEYNADGTLRKLRASAGAPPVISKRIVSDLDGVYFPDKFVLPFIEIVHDRAILEVQRGCIRGCRFCQAGFIYRPLREKSAEILNRNACDLIDASGYDEVSLTSLSTGDYAGLESLLGHMLPWTQKKSVNIALPSLRVDNCPDSLLEKIARVRRSGLTFAPEAGTQRLRDVINKNITDDEILDGCRAAFENGYTSVKLYFMIGLPTETMEDIDGIAETARRIVELFHKLPDKPKGKGVSVTVSVSCFVPKPFTPFEFEPMDTADMLREKQKRLLDAVRSKKISVKYHDADTSMLEAVLARGDRRMCAVVEDAWRAGSRLDGWSEHFSLERWMRSLETHGLEPAFYAHRRRDHGEIMPWSHLDYGVSRDYLIAENRRAHSGQSTPDCRTRCSGCGTYVEFCRNKESVQVSAPFTQGEAADIPAYAAGTDKGNGGAEVGGGGFVLHREGGGAEVGGGGLMLPLRLTFSKLGRAKYISHLDTMRTLTRALRRTGLPFWYTQGFNPHLYLTFALPLALGTESLCETLDLRLTEAVRFERVTELVGASFPPGFELKNAGAPELPVSDIAWADYRIILPTGTESGETMLEKLLGMLEQSSLEVIRSGKKGERTVDIRPHLELLDSRASRGLLTIRVRLAAGNELNVSPAMFLEAFARYRAVDMEAASIMRVNVLTRDLRDFK